MYQLIRDALFSFPAALTFRVCAACAVLYAAVGFPLSYLLSRSRPAPRKIISFFVTLPLIFPPIAIGFMLLMLLGRNGPIGRPLESFLGLRLIFSMPGIVLAAFIAGVPLLVRPLSAAMGRVEIIRMEEAARTLGCSPARVFLFVALPQSANTAISGLLLGLARASGEVGITMMLGGNISGRTNTLSLEIYNLVSRGEFDGAMGLCVLLAVAGVVIYAILECISAEGL
ncbi:MAG: ABC transporter permease subunit [Synergistaceae bacterium]|jgi:molybdate transport system permease protein|nr:ABC transporter permease subunit [Synergistaceae bacterium]